MKLIITATNLSGAVAFEVGYRLVGSGAPFTPVLPNPTSFPVIVNNVPNGMYEASIKKLTANGSICVPKYGVTDNKCSGPLSFSVLRELTNFKCTYVLAPGHTDCQIELNDPMGGIQLFPYSGSNTQTVTIPIAPFAEGLWRLRLRDVCDPTAVNLQSDWTGYVNFQIENKSTCPQVPGGNIYVYADHVTVVSDTLGSQLVGYTLYYMPVNGGTPVTVTNTTGIFDLYNTIAGIEYKYFIISNCADDKTSQPKYIGNSITANRPGLTQTQNSIVGSGANAVRTQCFTVESQVSGSPAVVAGNKFFLTVYNYTVTVTAVAGDTEATIAQKLAAAISGTSAALWRSVDPTSAPVDGTAGFKPTAQANGNGLCVTLDQGHTFAAGTSYN